MRKILIAGILFILTTNSFSQTCEKREEELLGMIGGFSAAMLYNTYGLIGAIADGFTKDAYNAETVESLMTAQKAMADNFIKMIKEAEKEKTFIQETNKEFMKSVSDIVHELKLQAQLLIDLSQTNSGKKKNAYEEQRKKSWSAISKLMGIDE